MTGPYDQPTTPASDPTDVPSPLPEGLPGQGDSAPMIDPPTDSPSAPQPLDNPDTPGLDVPNNAPSM